MDVTTPAQRPVQLGLVVLSLKVGVKGHGTLPLNTIIAHVDN